MKIEYTLTAEQDYIPVRGNAMASGDAAFDRACEDRIIEYLESGDIWAWAAVTVTAKVIGENGEEFKGRAVLGGCSYENEEDFRAPGGYFEDLKKEAADDLRGDLEHYVRSGNAAAKLLSGEN